MKKDITQIDINLAKDLFESKYKLSQNQVNILHSKLRHFTKIPSKFSTAKLKTIYFDDQINTSYGESINGDLIKTKYRFREYISPEKGGALYSLEIKKRNNTETSKLKKLIFNPLPQNYKFSTFRDLIYTLSTITKEDFKDLHNSLPERTLYPSTSIQYFRKRFDSFNGDVRYNLDTDIMVKISSQNFSHTEQTLNLNHSIFEIKSIMPEFFPSFLESLRLTPDSFSKFAWGKELISRNVN